MSTRKLYKRCISLAKKWPSQPKRSVNMQQVLLEQVRSTFRNTVYSEEAIEQGHHHADLMEKLLTGQLEPKDSQMKAYLPSEASFKLLDTDINKEINQGKIKPGILASFLGKF